MVKDKRLSVLPDREGKDAFLISNSEFNYARMNKAGRRWIVWLCREHSQFEAPDIKTALNMVNEHFKRYIVEGDAYEVYKRATEVCLF